MLLLWGIRYFDRNDRKFKDRSLRLDTQTLDPVCRAAIELVVNNEATRRGRDVVKYRHLFVEEVPGTNYGDPDPASEIRCFGVDDYFEDETGEEVSGDELGRLLTGSPTARLIPHGAKRHDIDFMFSEPRPLPVAEICLTGQEVRLLGYFARDLQELTNSAFLRDGPGTLSMTGHMSLALGSTPVLTTASTDDEIRSFVTIFRRLYMENEPANFATAAALFVKTLGDHPYSKWVAGSAAEFSRQLSAVPDTRPFLPLGTCTFTSKRLIDVFLYTQYAHQPDERRQKQFTKCLREVHGNCSYLAWLFHHEIWMRGREIRAVGRVVSGWFAQYCHHHAITPDVLRSLRDDLPGLGAGEKEHARLDRLKQAQIEKLAGDLWKQAGCPEGGPSAYLANAREQLEQFIAGS